MERRNKAESSIYLPHFLWMHGNHLPQPPHRDDLNPGTGSQNKLFPINALLGAFCHSNAKEIELTLAGRGITLTI